MIIVKLLGGLGNQMFQYACGKALAIKNNTSIAIDRSYLNERTWKGEYFVIRDYELDIFGIDCCIELHDIHSLFRVSATSTRKHPYIYIKERPYVFNHWLFQHGPNLWIQGYFQNIQYFSSITEEIRQDFIFPTEISLDNLALCDLIYNSHAISVHIRRGDYLTPSGKAVYAPCSASYYERSVKYMISNIKNPFFLVFCSDDADWAESLFKSFGVDYTVVLNNQGKKSYEDMRLMSLCRHNIIANSTFSWWGAWLNNFPEKIVIGPEKWYISPNEYTPILNEWIRIAN